MVANQRKIERKIVHCTVRKPIPDTVGPQSKPTLVAWTARGGGYRKRLYCVAE